MALAALVAWCLRRSSPVVRYWLWQIVAIKLLLMPFWSLAVPVPSWHRRTPPSQPVDASAARVPAAQGVRRGLGRLVLPHRIPMPQGEGPEAAPKSPSWGELWATISWQAWLMSAWLAVDRLATRPIAAATRVAGQVAAAGGRPRRGACPTGRRTGGTASGFAARPSLCASARIARCSSAGRGDRWLVLPSPLISSLGPAERRQVILHELAHVKRRDLVWGWTAEIARMIYFFHPLVWWVGYRLRLERELACDQLAMAHSGHPPADYAQTLVQVVSHASQQAGVQAAAISAELTGSDSSSIGKTKDTGL